MTINIEREPTLRSLFEQIATRLGIHPDDPAQTTLELIYVNGDVRRAHIHRELKRSDIDRIASQT